MNKQQIIKQQENIKAVKKIIKNHKTHDTSKIKGFLLAEYNLPVTNRSIRRYLIMIKKEPKIKKIKNKKIKIAKVKKQEINKAEFPYTIKDPSGKEHKITGDNHTITLTWGNLGMITWDKKDKIWRYEHSGKPFNKNDKPKPYHKVHGVSWEYDDL